VTPIINTLVAAATRSGTPQREFSIGTIRMPPPMPMSDVSTPAANDTAAASGTRFTRYSTSPPVSSS
jgi:hypothetical protein